MPAAQCPSDLIDRRALLALARALIRIPTPNPPGDERLAAKLLEPRLREIGFVVKRVISPAGRWNLLAVRGFDGSGSRMQKSRARTFLFNGHLDVVPVGDREAWTHPPFGGKVTGGKLWGRGAVDMKGGVAAMIEAAAAVARSGIRSPHRVAIHLVSDEEALGGEGTEFLARKKLLRADMAVVGEPTGLLPALASKGTLRGRIHLLGKAAHSSTPERGVNAVLHAAYLIQRLSRLEFRARHPLLGRPSLVVSKIQGGVRSNIVPPSCTIEFDRRVIPGETEAQIRREIAGVLRDLRRTHAGFRAKVEYGVFARPSEIPGNSEVVRLADAALRAVDGRSPRHTALSGTTDARFLIHLARIPTVILGPGDLGQAHAANEHVRVADLGRAARVYAFMIARFLASP